MIQLLATKYCRHIAYYMFLIFCTSLAPAVYGKPGRNHDRVSVNKNSGDRGRANSMNSNGVGFDRNTTRNSIDGHKEKPLVNDPGTDPDQDFIGGPGQPEMSSFQSIGT